MTMEVAGSLIEMNVHNVANASARNMLDLAIILIIISIIVAFIGIVADAKDKKIGLIACAFAFFVIGIGFLIFGSNMPKVKEINYCANGPVQIEQIAATYDIINIDGKQITVRERGK